MEHQTSFSDVEYASHRVTTRKEEFLRQMDGLVPWAEWCALIAPYWHPTRPGKRGRRPVPVETMLRLYLLQCWYNLSDVATEEAVYDSRAMSRFVGVDFSSGSQVPDSTTLCKFRKCVTDNGLGERMLDSLNAILEAAGIMMRGGSIVDATFVEAPSSTKNAGKSRDPEAHQGKKGKNWHFGYKAHTGVDAGSGLVHTVVVTPANESDISQAHRLFRPDDGFGYADAGYAGMGKRDEFRRDPDLGTMELRISARPSSMRAKGDPAGWDKAIERMKSAVRSKVEHPYQILKRRFGFGKTRYRGLRRNAAALNVRFALANLAMVASAGRRLAPTAA
ncbi:MAG: IS5 family transposase [Atopobiaceae bacterium]|nr:IS5 family transposase [Atopobiaceae bacterium]